jgi:probable phosphoglycerate mutase
MNNLQVIILLNKSMLGLDSEVVNHKRSFLPLSDFIQLSGVGWLKHGGMRIVRRFMKTTLYLIRHGQTEWNVERRMQGQTDSPLTPKGIRMTERLALKLPTMDEIYVSPLGRTMHTAELLFGRCDLKKEDRLREINLGEWEGRLQADLDVEEPEQHTNFWKNPDQFQVAGGIGDPAAGSPTPPTAKDPASPMPATTYSGENCYDISKCFVECMQDLAAKHEGETIALVSHTTIIRAMLFHVEQRPLSEF